MSDWNGAINFVEKLFGNYSNVLKPHGYVPTAQTRITRTPIYKEDTEGNLGLHYNSEFPNHRRISVPNQSKISEDTLVHESGHNIYDSANLSDKTEELYKILPERLENFVKNYNPVFKNIDKDQLINESLAFSLMNSSKPSNAAFIRNISDKIDDPEIKKQLLRLLSQRRKMYYGP